ncbi:hypothetical protein ABPG74_007704 [Tetrahymena malaccensis]
MALGMIDASAEPRALVDKFLVGSLYYYFEIAGDVIRQKLDKAIDEKTYNKQFIGIIANVNHAYEKDKSFNLWGQYNLSIGHIYIKSNANQTIIVFYYNYRIKQYLTQNDIATYEILLISMYAHDQ